MFNEKYPHVYAPMQLGPVRLKNHIAVSPMMNGLSTPDGKVTPELLAHMRAKAKTGAGLVIVGDSSIDYEYGVTHYTPLNLGDESNSAGLAHMAEEVHRFGAKIGIELQHGGAAAYDRATTTRHRLSPVPDMGTPGGWSETDAIVITREHMDRLVARYVDVARRLETAGFDELLIHCAHGWLLSQFLDRRYNTRTDEYGGSLENRMRFPLEVIKAVHDAVGDRLAVDIRVSVGGPLSPYTEQDLQDTIAFVRAASPYIASANVSVMDNFIFETSEYMCQSYYLPHMVNTDWAARVRAAGVGAKISAVGSIVTVAEAEDIIASGRADFVFMGRASLVDGEHFEKVRKGREQDVRPCLRCAHCTDRLYFFKAIRCAVNPLLGRETEYPAIYPAPVKKKVLVAGGGPAGMEAARTAVLRGHDVVLYEKSAALGGRLHTAGALPIKADTRRYTDWMVKKTLECGARIVTGTEVTPGIIAAEAPDAVILAVGADIAMPPIPGLRGKNVITAEQADLRLAPVGDTVVMAGAGLSGCECAIALAEAGKMVTIVDIITEARFRANGDGGQCWMSIIRRIGELGIALRFETAIREIGENGVSCRAGDGGEFLLPADTVINALGMRADTDYVESLAVLPDTYTAGDCAGGAMSIDNAVMTGFTWAMEI